MEVLELIPSGAGRFCRAFYRDEETLAAVELYFKACQRGWMTVCHCRDLDAWQRASSSVASDDMLLKKAAHQISGSCVLLAPPKCVARMKEAHPDVPIVDRGCRLRKTETKLDIFIPRVLGDAGTGMFRDQNEAQMGDSGDQVLYSENRDRAHGFVDYICVGAADEIT